MNPRIADWRGRHVWLVGASTGIGAALARALSAEGAHLALSARNGTALQALDLPGALCLPCDATNVAQLEGARAILLARWPRIDLVVYLAGDYEPMRADTLRLDAAERVVAVNFLGAMRLTALVHRDLPPGGGIAFVASVAGYRGLPQALCYGPGKAALIHWAECLYQDLHPRGVGVWLINPGFVATRLTDRNPFPMPALLTPEAAAQAMLRGWRQGRFEIHFPRRFTWVLKALASLPYRLYFPLIRRLTGG